MPIEQLFGHWIARLYRSSQNYFAKKLAKLHIGRGQHSFLLVLFSKDGISQDYLARALHINKAAVARALSKLEQSGYVERKKDDADRRNNYVYLTNKAKKIKTELLSEIGVWTDTLAEGFSDADRKQLIVLLKRMGDNADRATNNNISISERDAGGEI
ncbi:MarR family winged helix-turn-helix transcriptional regulator [Chloroflexota bacterium]